MSAIQAFGILAIVAVWLLGCLILAARSVTTASENPPQRRANGCRYGLSDGCTSAYCHWCNA